MASLLPVPEALALCPPQQNVRVEDPFAYVGALVDSLSWAKEAGSRLKTSSNDIAELVYALKRIRADYKCAITTVEPFESSRNDFISKTATLTRRVYGNLGETIETVLGDVLKLVDSHSKGVTPSQREVIDRLTDLRLRNEDMLKMLPMVSAQAMHAVVKFSDAGEATGQLRLTRAQRQQLTKQIERVFGRSVRGGLQAGQYAVEGAASLIHQFLSDQKWRSLDDR